MAFEHEQSFVRRKARENATRREQDKVLWSRHAIGKLIAEGLSRQEVEETLRSCEVLEQYPAGGRPLPDVLAIGWVSGQQAIHSVIALDEPNDRVFVVTVYRPDRMRWEDGYRVRKR